MCSISPWAILAASLALILVTVGFTMLGEALRDVLDPKLSGLLEVPGDV